MEVTCWRWHRESGPVHLGEHPALLTPTRALLTSVLGCGYWASVSSQASLLLPFKHLHNPVFWQGHPHAQLFVISAGCLGGTYCGKFWALAASRPLGYRLTPFWTEPIQTGQGICLCGSIRTGTRRPAVLRARETPSPGSALFPRKDLTHQEFQQLSMWTGRILDLRIELTNGERYSFFQESLGILRKEADFVSMVWSCWLLANDSLMPFCDSIVSDVLANDG